MTATAADTKLTRAEAAYAHLASFQRGERVIVTGRAYAYEGTVTTTQRHDFADINRVYLTVSNGRTEIQVTVGQLLAGRAITSRADVEAGRIHHFDAARYVA